MFYSALPHEDEVRVHDPSTIPSVRLPMMQIKDVNAQMHGESHQQYFNRLRDSMNGWFGYAIGVNDHGHVVYQTQARFFDPTTARYR